MSMKFTVQRINKLQNNLEQITDTIRALKYQTSESETFSDRLSIIDEVICHLIDADRDLIRASHASATPKA